MIWLHMQQQFVQLLVTPVKKVFPPCLCEFSSLVRSCLTSLVIKLPVLGTSRNSSVANCSQFTAAKKRINHQSSHCVTLNVNNANRTDSPNISHKNSFDLGRLEYFQKYAVELHSIENFPPLKSRYFIEHAVFLFSRF